MKKIFLILITGLFYFQINAQLVNVNSSSYSTSTPLECNNFSVTVNGVVNCINFPFDSTSFTIVGTTIEVGVYYSGGLICAGALNPYTHNVNLGMIPQGTYNVSIKGYLNLVVDDALAAPSVTIGSCCGTNASFTSNKSVGCTDDTNSFIFTNTSTGNTSNEWFMDGFPVATSTDLSLSLSTIGSYEIKLVTSDGICSDSTIQTFNVYQSPSIDLGNDTTSCIGSNHNIIAPNGFNAYSWTNSSSTSNVAVVNTSNTYKVTATDMNGCSAEDSISLVFNTLPVFSLGLDTSICSGQNLILDAGVFDSYSWNTSETTQTIAVNSSFNYVATVTDANNCSSSDDIAVFVHNLPNVSLGQDTIEVCSGNTVNINAGTFSSYLWTTVETTSSIDIGTQGVVGVTVTDANNCSNSDDTYIKVNALPVIDFGAATLGFCSGSSVTLNPGSFNSYVWNTTDISSTLNVNTADTYSVTVTDGNNCSNSASVVVEENMNPTVNLGEDVDLCKTDKIILNAGAFDSYIWNDASSASTLEVNGADFVIGNNTFNVEVTDNNGCKGTDEIVLNVKECDVSINSVLLESLISIYPNPANNYLNIQVSKEVSSNVKIFNVLGKEVMTINSQRLNSNSSVDVSNLNEGIYFVEISIDNERLVKQFLKTK